MSTFIIETSNHKIGIRVARSAEDFSDAEHFSNEAELTILVADQPMSMLVEVWKSLPGVRAVTKFTDRKTAIARIWRAVQSLDQTHPPESTHETAAAAPTAHVGAPSPRDGVLTATPTTEADLGKPARKRRKGALAVEPVAANTKASKEPPKKITGNGGKTAQLIALMERAYGATLDELMAVSGWQAHSVRGFISGTLGKKMGLAVVSVKGEGGKRTYSICA
jgi:Protein of unknown function (DUF3489)